MTLGDLSNVTLSLLQQPGASFTVGGGGSPNWSSPAPGLTVPQFGQGLVEFALNEGYKKLCGDLEALELAMVTAVFPSVANTFKYPIPPSASFAKLSHVAHVYYQPVGLPYTREFEPGTRLISWTEYNNRTGWGYLWPFSFGSEPMYATFDPDRQNVYFYPGSASPNDTITVKWSFIPTFNANNAIPAANGGILTKPTDIPLLPDDTHMAIVYYALGVLWMRAREFNVSRAYFNSSKINPGFYQVMVDDIRLSYTRKFSGDTIQIKPFADTLKIGDDT